MAFFTDLIRMANINYRSFIPHIISVLLFIVLSYCYFTPVIEGKVLVAHDSDSWRYMSQETVEYNKTHDVKTLWTNSMFGGMPTYQISMDQPYNFIQNIDTFITKLIPRPVSNVLLYLFGFYILLLAFGLKPWQALVGSLGFTFASYNFIIIAAGHITKAVTIAYMAPIIGGVYLAFHNKRMLGAILTAIFLSLAIRANHFQILYYTLFILVAFAIVEFIYSLIDKKLPSFIKSTVFLMFAALVAIGSNSTLLLTTYEYSQYTMRGKSNGLTADTQSQQGLSTDYITNWSYGIDETMTLLIPDFKGGASGGKLGAKSETAQYLQNLGVPKSQIESFVKQMPLYWGTQPFTSGPVYLGAIVIFLFVLSFFLVDKRIKWWLVPIIILTLALSWGKNFMPLTNFFIEHIPLYNKFRTVSMTLVATGFGITLLAFLAMKEVYEGNIEKNKLSKSILISGAITGGICLIFALLPSLSGNFISPQDAQFKGDYAFLKETLPIDRKSLLRADAWRSLLFVLLGTIVLWAFVKEYLKKNVSVALLGFFILIDLFIVDKRYLNDDNFGQKRPQQFIQTTPADDIILQDKTQYRVLNATVNIFNDASPSYFHKNIGGYHAAKLRRYQELIDMQLEKEVGQLFGAFNESATPESLNSVLDSLHVLNMLNLKYVIYNKQAPPLVNPYHNGNAWFVDSIRIAANADEEMELLGQINTKRELVIDQSLASSLPKQIISDTTASIVLTSYAPNHLVYHVNTKTDQVAVFSEIFYDKGWKASINKEDVPYTRVNYLLRGMPLKAGSYDLEFTFKPASYSTGNTLSLISSLILILMIVAGLYLHFRKEK